MIRKETVERSLESSPGCDDVPAAAGDTPSSMGQTLRDEAALARPGARRTGLVGPGHALACAGIAGVAGDTQEGGHMSLWFGAPRARPRGRRHRGRGEGLPALAVLAVMSVLSAAVAGSLRGRRP